jgi:hypothetical protein
MFPLIFLLALASPTQSDERPASDVRTAAPKPLRRSWTRGPLELALSISDESPLAADTLTVRLQASTSGAIQLELPALDDWPKDFEIRRTRRSGPTIGPDGRTSWELSFDVDVLHAGEYELPALPVRHRTGESADWTTAETEPVSIEFRSLLGDDPDRAAPRPNPGPAELPRGPLPWLFIAAVALGAALVIGSLVALFVWQSRRPKPPALVSAYRKAMDAIHRIDMSSLFDRGEVDRFFTELSDVVRRYVEDRYGLRAPEQTTEEFLQALTKRPVLAGVQVHSLARFMEQCDLVKFARVRPTSSEGQSALRAARDFVESTRDDSVLVAARRADDERRTASVSD